MSAWSITDIPDQSGKIAIVTGANSGLGLETARGLANAGARVVLACRNTGNGEAAMEDIRRCCPQADISQLKLDLADLASVRQFATDFNQAHDRLDILVNNAGVMALPERRTADGFEMQNGTNHLGHFALTGLLLDKLKATAGARVVTVSSLAHRFGKMNIEDFNWQRRRYQKWQAYGQAKLANLMFALELQRRLEAANEDMISVAAHPGFAATHLQFAGAEMTGSKIKAFGMKISNTLFSQSQADGALPSLYAATAPDVKGGDYYGPDGAAEMRGGPAPAKIAGHAKKQEPAKKLWTLSEQLTGVGYPL